MSEDDAVYSPRRSSRPRQLGALSYDQSHHPIDAVTRPSRVAKKLRTRFKAAHDFKQKASSAKSIKDSIKITRNETPANLTDPGEQTSFVDPHVVSLSAPHQEPNAGHRRSSRVHLKDHHPNYSVRFHPSDEILRPIHAAKVLKMQASPASRTLQLQKSPSQVKGSPELLLFGHSHSTAPGEPVPYTLPFRIPSALGVETLPVDVGLAGIRPIDWNNLTDHDRLLFRLQKGAPFTSDTLPLSWQKAIDELSDSGLLVHNDNDDTESIKWIANRYDHLQKGLQEFFGSQVEVNDRKDWTILRPEGIDVYRIERGARGRKYWRHYEESIVQPQRSTRANDTKQDVQVKPSLLQPLQPASFAFGQSVPPQLRNNMKPRQKKVHRLQMKGPPLILQAYRGDGEGLDDLIDSEGSLTIFTSEEPPHDSDQVDPAAPFASQDEPSVPPSKTVVLADETIPAQWYATHPMFVRPQEVEIAPTAHKNAKSRQTCNVQSFEIYEDEL